MPHYSITIPAPCRWISSNDRHHWAKRNEATQQWREAAGWRAKAAKFPPLERVAITATVARPGRRRRDAHNVSPTIKAAIDGLVDAGVIPDDSDEYITKQTTEAAKPGPGSGPLGTLTLTIEEALVARAEARTYVSIWSDPAFLGLTVSAQRMYWFLKSQPDLDHTGVISLRERRWAKKAAGLTVAQIAEDLTELAKANFVVVDEDHEEVLIRSFMRQDKVYRQPNVLRAAVRQLESVSSPVIRGRLAVEVERIAEEEDMPEGSNEPFQSLRDSLADDFREELLEPSVERFSEGFTEGFQEGYGDGGPTPSGVGVGVGEGVKGVGGVGEGEKPAATSQKKRAPKPGSDQDPDWVEFYRVYPLKKSKDDARKAWAKAIKRADASVIINKARSYAKERRGQDPTFTKHPATWLNKGCWDDEPASTANNSNGPYQPYQDPDPALYHEGEL